MIKFHKQLLILFVIILDRFSCGQQNGFTATYLYSEPDNNTTAADTTLEISEESSTIFDSKDTSSEISPFAINYNEHSTTEEPSVAEATTVFSTTYSSTTEMISESTENSERCSTSAGTTPTTEDYSSTSTEYYTTTEENTKFTGDSTSEMTSTTTETPPYCEGENIIILNVVPSSFSIFLNWSCLGEGCSNSKCEYSYNITFNNKSVSRVENSINITENIYSCVTYSGVIELIYNNNSVNSTPFTVTTLPAIDPVQNLTLHTDTENPHIILTWIPTKRSQYCVNNYLYEVFEDDISIWKSHQPIPQLDIFNVDGCKDNVYEIYAVYNESLISNSKKKAYSNLTVNEAPIFVDKNITQDNNVFIWWKFGKSCKPSQFFVECQLNKSKPFEVKGMLNDDILIVELWYLESYQNYSCHGRIENEKGNSSWSEKVYFETFASDPEMPESLIIYQDENDTGVDISWTPPLKWNGEEEEYKLIIKFVQINYTVPDNCPVLYEYNVTEYMNSSTTRYNFTDPAGLAEYKVSVSAISSGGEGRANETSFITLEQVPDIPDKLEITENIVSLESIYNVSFDIIWMAPCKINGNLRNYTLKVAGPFGFNFTKTIGLLDGSQYNFLVQPDSEYKIEIQANLNVLQGKIGKINKFSSAGSKYGLRIFIKFLL